MRFKLLLTGFLITITTYLSAQTLSGKITNTQNEPIIGASVQIVGASRGTTTNVEGRYNISLPADGKYEIEVSAVGYVSKIISDIEKTNGAYNELNIVLETKSAEMEGVTVSARRTSARMETAASAITFQKNTNTVASVVSAETIRRSPDKNTGEVLKRTPGASLQDGRFLIVRGLADRYNTAMLNGILLTSTEPERKTFSFDLIPAQAIDNIIINKAFVPELPGEWAGGLVQINTRDIPVKNFLNVQVGAGYNTATTFKTFYKDAQGGGLDWLGIDDGTRDLPDNYTTKSNFDTLSRQEKNEVGKKMRNAWMPEKIESAPLNHSFILNGGFNANLGTKKLGGVLGLTYSRSYKYQELLNRRNSLNKQAALFDTVENFIDGKYQTETIVGAFGSTALQLNSNNKISLKGLINVNGNNNAMLRSGRTADRSGNPYIMGNEFSFKENIFFSSQLIGEHSLSQPLKFKWYGAFSILSAYSPDQRRLTYERLAESDPWVAIISSTLSQQSGSHVYQTLNDYIYTAGGDLAYNFRAFNNQSQTVRGGYMFQVKDRLFDANVFSTFLPVDNFELRKLLQDKIFSPENFGNGYDNKFAFAAIKNRNYRYLANTILNSGFVQFDNQLTRALRVVWGLRVENYDQLIGSVKKWDPRHYHINKTDFLPGLNATYKINNLTNLRLSASQTVLRPELRELSATELYDFELNASLRGNPQLKTGRVLNTDLRYEIYPRAGETFSVGAFYKKFKTPIEQVYTDGGGGSSSFYFTNPEGAYAYGAEVEIRKKLDMIDALRNFTVQSNVSVIKSRIQDKEQKIDRALQGQSPYLVNAALLYDHEPTGLNITTLFNIVGERIYLVGDYVAGAPDVYEAPRAVLDLQIAKKILSKKGELKLNISDILNRTHYFYQNVDPDKEHHFQKGTDAIRFARKYGTTFNLTFNYSIF